MNMNQDESTYACGGGGNGSIFNLAITQNSSQLSFICIFYIRIDNYFTLNLIKVFNDPNFFKT